MSASSTVVFRDPAGHLCATVLATAYAYVKRSKAYVIDIIRTPLFPLVYFVTWRVAYAVAGRGHVDGANASGFLLVGMFGLITWSSTIWSSGYAIEHERHEGTVGALFLSPASRSAVVVGYGLGSLVWLLPSFLQLPIYLLAGFVVPRARLPDWLHPLSDAIPASHAMDALRASSLGGATLHGITGQLALAFGTAALYALVGWISLRRVENVAKRAGQLDLY